MPQTEVIAEPTEASIAGLVADISPRTIRSGVSEISAAQPFGIFVKRGTTDSRFALLSSASDKTIGVLAHSYAINTLGIAGAAEPIKQKDVANVLTRGCVYVPVEEAVTPADPVYARFANGVADNTKVQRGAVRKTSDSNTAFLVRGARFLSSAAAGALAIVEFDAAVESAVKGIDGSIAKISLTPGVKAANAIDVVGQLQDADGNPVAAVRQVYIKSLAVTADKGDLAAASAAVGTVKKANNPTTGENALWMETSAAGAFSFKVSNDQAEETLVQVTTENGITAAAKLNFA